MPVLVQVEGQSRKKTMAACMHLLYIIAYVYLTNVRE